jgi:hypothetical protein
MLYGTIILEEGILDGIQRRFWEKVVRNSRNAAKWGKLGVSHGRTAGEDIFCVVNIIMSCNVMSNTISI